MGEARSMSPHTYWDVEPARHFNGSPSSDNRRPADAYVAPRNRYGVAHVAHDTSYPSKEAACHASWSGGTDVKHERGPTPTGWDDDSTRDPQPPADPAKSAEPEQADEALGTAEPAEPLEKTNGQQAAEVAEAEAEMLSAEAIAAAIGAPPRRGAAQQAMAKLQQTAVVVQDTNAKDHSTGKAPRRSVGGNAKPSLAEMAQANQFEQDGKLWELQFRNCQVSRYGTYSRCVACISRQAGDTCRFVGLRAFVVDRERGQPYPASDARNDTPPHLISTRNPEQKLVFPSNDAFNRPMTAEDRRFIQQTIARHLLPILESELKHARLPRALQRERETICRQMCEFCNTSIFSASWLCLCCGREYCPDCGDAIGTASDDPSDAIASDRSRTRLWTCAKGRLHNSTDLIPLTRFQIGALEGEIAEMQRLEAQRKSFLPMPDRPQPEQSAASQETKNHGEPFYKARESVKWDSVSPYEAGVAADRLSSPLEPRTFDRRDMTNDLMEREWASGEPMLVRDISGLKHTWDPKAFIERYGGEACHIVRCDKEPTMGKDNDGITSLSTVGDFFRTFGASRKEREDRLGKGSWKLKDWPPTADFKETFPALNDDFNCAVPVPDYTRRDGVLNLASCYPANVIQPDLGPKMYNAWPSSEALGGKGTTRLHMDMADAVNIMLHADPPRDQDLPEQLKDGVAAWDIFRAEDADKIRAFLRAEYDPAGEYKDDPIHTQRYFIDAPGRVKLFEKHGVRGWRIYQKVGEAVFIPAGCAHQVCNLADCIKVAVDFVSPQNVARCFKLTSEFRELTHDQRAWKEDVLSLRTTLWYAWCTSRRLASPGEKHTATSPALADGDVKVMMVAQRQSPSTSVPAPRPPSLAASKPQRPKKRPVVETDDDEADSDPLTDLSAGEEDDEVVHIGAPKKAKTGLETAKRRKAGRAAANGADTDDGDYEIGGANGGSKKGAKASTPRAKTARRSATRKDSSRATSGEPIGSSLEARRTGGKVGAAAWMPPQSERDAAMQAVEDQFDKNMSTARIEALALWCRDRYMERGLEWPQEL